MTYNVFGGTLSLTHSIRQVVHAVTRQKDDSTLWLEG